MFFALHKPSRLWQERGKGHVRSGNCIYVPVLLYVDYSNEQHSLVTSDQACGSALALCQPILQSALSGDGSYHHKIPRIYCRPPISLDSNALYFLRIYSSFLPTLERQPKAQIPKTVGSRRLLMGNQPDKSRDIAKQTTLGGLCCQCLKQGRQTHTEDGDTRCRHGHNLLPQAQQKPR